LLSLLTLVHAANNVTDKVTGLPFVGPLPSRWWSGYLNTVSPTRTLHYVFVESLSNPYTDPVLIWFNGGPGCSSLSDFFTLSGPYIFDDGESVIKPNPWPWNVRANMLYIENPAGVGYSWGKSEDDLLHNDISQSIDVFNALQEFFKAFPAYL
jgi:carboxypeptidase C (cathepsin A)